MLKWEYYNNTTKHIPKDDFNTIEDLLAKKKSSAICYSANDQTIVGYNNDGKLECACIFTIGHSDGNYRTMIDINYYEFILSNHIRIVDIVTLNNTYTLDILKECINILINVCKNIKCKGIQILYLTDINPIHQYIKDIGFKHTHSALCINRPLYKNDIGLLETKSSYDVPHTMRVSSPLAIGASLVSNYLSKSKYPKALNCYDEIPNDYKIKLKNNLLLLSNLMYNGTSINDLIDNIEYEISQSYEHVNVLELALGQFCTIYNESSESFIYDCLIDNLNDESFQQFINTITFYHTITKQHNIKEYYMILPINHPVYNFAITYGFKPREKSYVYAV